MNYKALYTIFSVMKLPNWQDKFPSWMLASSVCVALDERHISVCVYVETCKSMLREYFFWITSYDFKERRYDSMFCFSVGGKEILNHNWCNILRIKYHAKLQYTNFQTKGQKFV